MEVGAGQRGLPGADGPAALAGPPRLLKVEREGVACAMSSLIHILAWGSSEGFMYALSALRTASLCVCVALLLSCSQEGTGPVTPPRFAEVTMVSAGWAQTCGLQADSTAVCWGTGPLGRLPDSTLNACRPSHGYCVPIALPVTGGLTFGLVSSGLSLTCGLSGVGTAWCWGSIGGWDYSTWSSATPDTLRSTVKFVSVGSGIAHSCGLTSTGTAYCWGANYDGELGAGLHENQLESSDTPVAVAGGLTFTQLAVGAYHTCGLVAEGIAYCWGSNASGQLGNDTVSAKPDCGAIVLLGDSCSWFPVPVQGGQVFAVLGAGGAHSCGILKVGALLCWGSNAAGQVGVSDTSHHCGNAQGICLPEPTAVGFPFGTADSTISRVALGGSHTCATTSGGTLFCWGDNTFGQLGIGSTTGIGCPSPVSSCRPTPSPVLTLPSAIVSLAAGSKHTCAALASLAAYCWGGNDAGQLGNNSLVDSPRPAQVQLGTVR